MPSREIEEFASKLVRAVRDQAIQSCDANALPAAQNIVAKRWRRTNAERAGEVMVPDAVDEALFFLLTAIDQGVVRLTYTADDGRAVDLSETGELAGWYIGPDGWRRKYSSERYLEFTSDENAS